MRAHFANPRVHYLWLGGPSAAYLDSMDRSNWPELQVKFHASLPRLHLDAIMRSLKANLSRRSELRSCGGSKTETSPSRVGSVSAQASERREEFFRPSAEMYDLPRHFRGTPPPQAPPFVQLFIQSDDVEAIAKKAQEPGARLIFGPAALPDGDWMAVLTVQGWPLRSGSREGECHSHLPVGDQPLKRVNATALMKTA
jgi:hypothetical protein